MGDRQPPPTAPRLPPLSLRTIGSKTERRPSTTPTDSTFLPPPIVPGSKSPLPSPLPPPISTRTQGASHPLPPYLTPTDASEPLDWSLFDHYSRQRCFQAHHLCRTTDTQLKAARGPRKDFVATASVPPEIKSGDLAEYPPFLAKAVKFFTSDYTVIESKEGAVETVVELNKLYMQARKRPTLMAAGKPNSSNSGAKAFQSDTRRRTVTVAMTVEHKAKSVLERRRSFNSKTGDEKLIQQPAPMPRPIPVVTEPVEKSPPQPTAPKAGSRSPPTLDTTDVGKGTEVDRSLLSVRQSVYTKGRRKSLQSSNTIIIPSPRQDFPTKGRPAPFEPISQPYRLLVRCRSLHIELGNNFEPYFCTMALYRLGGESQPKPHRISADFKFEVNPAPLKQSLYGAERMQAMSELVQMTNAIFTLSEPSPDIVVVLKIARLMRPGDFSSMEKMYVKPSAVKQKELDKLQKETRDICSSDYLQSFAWSCLRVFEDDGALCGKELVFAELRPVKSPLSDEAIFEALEKEGADKDKKVKCIKGQFLATLETITEPKVDGTVVTPGLVVIKEEDAKDSARTIASGLREVQDFGQVLQPMCYYINNLHLYPESVQLRHSANIMLEFQLRESDDGLESSTLASVYAHWGSEALVKSGFTLVSQKERKDQFWDEMVLQLPARLTSRHHILVVIHSVSTGKKKDAGEVVGYVVIPLIQRTQVIPDMQHTFPILTTLPDEYLAVVAATDATNGSFVEKQRQTFSMRSKLVSSVYTSDPRLSNFVECVEKECERKKGASENAALSKPTLDAVTELGRLHPAIAVRCFPVVFDYLLELLGHSEELDEALILALVSIVNGLGKSLSKPNVTYYLHSYVWFWYNLGFAGKDVPKADVAGAILRVWRRQLLLPREAQTVFSGFESCFLLDLVVKVIVLQLQAGGQLQCSDRSKLYKESLREDLESVMSLLFVPQKLGGSTMGIPSATRFIRNLLQLYDRGRIFCWLRSYFKKMEPDDQQTVKIKFTFLKSFVDDCNFVSMCLPVPVPITSVSTVQTNFWRVHYFSGQILNEVSNCLTDFNSPDVNFCRKFAIDSLNSILAKLFNLEVPENELEQIAGLFFPYVLIVSKNILVVEQFTSSQKYDWMVAFVQILAKVSSDMLKAYWKVETQRGLSFFCKALSESLGVLSSGNYGHQRSRQMSVLPPPTSDMTGLGEFTMKDLQRIRDMASHPEEDVGTPEIQAESHMVICQCVLSFLECFRSEISTGDSPVAEAIFSVILHLAKIDDAEMLCKVDIFLVLKLFVTQFRDLLFKFQNKFALDLTYQILRHCNSPSRKVRSQACAAFFLLLDENYASTGGYERMAVVSSVALSELLGKSIINSTDYIRESLDAVQRYAEESMKEEEKNTQLKELLLVLELNAKLLEYNQTIIKVSSTDSDLTTNLYEKIANSYIEAPDTRVQWLENMATYHYSHKNLAEAALCKIHHASLVLEYLQKYSGGRNAKFPVQRAQLLVISPGLEKDAPLPNLSGEKVEAQFQLSTWGVDGFVELLEKASEWLNQATLLELCLEIYSILEVVFKFTRNYTRLRDCLDRYSETVKAILSDPQRFRAKYYRASFYGKRTKDLEGRSFIYRMDAKSSLLSFTNKIKDTFKEEVSSPNDFVMLPNKPVDPETVTDDKIYLQIGGVSEYSSDTEGETSFDVNHCVDRFLFEMSHQKTQKKKFIYYTEYPFPYIKSRLEIVKQDELILSPIESAIENVMDRVKAIRTELTAAVPRVNTLQQILQGSVVPMVNEGPLKICADFLAPEKEQEFDSKKVAELRDALRDFIRNCGFALRLNARLIDEKHKPFQDMCQQKYEELSKMIKTYIDVEE